MKSTQHGQFIRRYQATNGQWPKPANMHLLRQVRLVMQRVTSLVCNAMALTLLFHSLVYSARFSVDGFALERVTAGLSLPTAMAFHSDGRIFIAEKGGVVRVLQNGTLLDTPFVSVGEVNNHRDRGLIGIAVDPDFDNNGYVYLSYTYENNPSNLAGAKTARVVRYTADGNTAIEGSRLVLLGSTGGTSAAPSCADYAIDADCIASDSITHTVGGLRFGPDNKLYVAVGDGADFNGIDLNAFRAQNLDNMSGKILRIERDGRGVVDNPFFTGNADEIRSKVWAYGFRNPFRFNFHPDGRLFGGDVGWATREEINFIVAGNNYGWPCREGSAPAGGGYSELEQCLQGGGYVEPIHDYLHVNRRGAVVGGSFATSADYPSWLRGSYVYADFSLGNLQYLTLDAQSNVSVASELATDVGGPAEIVTGPDGTIYYLSVSAGELYRIKYTGNSSATAPVASASYQTSNQAPLTATFDATESRTNASPVEYQWDFGDGSSGRGITSTHTYENSATYLVTLTVTTANGESDSVSFEVDLNNASESDSQPFLASLTSDETVTAIGAPVNFSAEIGNSADGEPFSVRVEITDRDNQTVRQVSFDSVQISAGSTTAYEFTWLPVGIGTYYVSIGFYRANSNHQIQPQVSPAAEVQVVARSRAMLALGGGTFNPFDLLMVVMFMLLLASRRIRFSATQ